MFKPTEVMEKKT